MNHCLDVAVWMENDYWKKPFATVGLGGTFDHLHEGHKLLLKTAIKLGTKVYIGLSEKAMTTHKSCCSLIEPYCVRKENLANYLEEQILLPKEQYEILSLKDFSGPSITDETLEALVCSAETYPNAQRINRLRIKKEKPLLTVVVIPLLCDKKGRKISSTAIRESIKNQIQPEHVARGGNSINGI